MDWLVETVGIVGDWSNGKGCDSEIEAIDSASAGAAIGSVGDVIIDSLAFRQDGSALEGLGGLGVGAVI
jgi:hypothetical protein